MEIIHVSAECYPVAKVGGLGDVVGALPKYQNKFGHFAKVVMPMFRTKFLNENEWEVDFKGYTNMGSHHFDYTIIKEKSNKLGYDLYLVDINGLLDREKVYGYNDDTERFTAFQIAVLHWMARWEHKPDIVHCHDHHTSLIPFMMKYCYEFSKLASVPTVVTIHNAQYQGWMSWDKSSYLPAWDTWKYGMLDWDKIINPLASGIKCADKVTTVSWSYLEELSQSANGLENLFEYERGKCVGILNGIDTEVWNTETDPLIFKNYTRKDKVRGKLSNKKALCKQFDLNFHVPLIVFIGRLVAEKAADILPEAIISCLYQCSGNVNFLILGSGDTQVERRLEGITHHFPGQYNCVIGYNEQLSHQMYAGADFLLMPSRVEPCGLNQLYAMRYGTVPMVRKTGGLKDTVIDMGEENGYGITFNNASVADIQHAVERAIYAFGDHKAFDKMGRKIMELDYSWDRSAKQYIDVYHSILKD